MIFVGDESFDVAKCDHLFMRRVVKMKKKTEKQLKYTVGKERERRGRKWRAREMR